MYACYILSPKFSFIITITKLHGKITSHWNLVFTHPINGGGIMKNQNPVQFSGKVLDQRNDLTGPDAGKALYPKLPKHVAIQDSKQK